jgi:tRNA pseudouridine13 synthase
MRTESPNGTDAGSGERLRTGSPNGAEAGSGERLSVGELPRGLGDAVLRATLRSMPEDFRVDEVLGFAPSGVGEHLFLEIEKRGANTAWVAQRLAHWAGVAEMAVGYAGLKDRHAVTRQAFTVHLPKRIAPDFSALANEAEFRVISQTWHAKKLPRGALRGNRFVLRLRDLMGEHEMVEQRLREIATRGVPNYFGEQRFGRDGGNLAAARAMFAGKRMGRDKRSILLSAARSVLFNAVLAERVQRGDWERGADGEVWMLDGSHSVFGPEAASDDLRQRCAALDIHPTGPLWGAGTLRTAGAVRDLETTLVAAQSDLADGLVKAGLKQERRALRLPVRELVWRWLDDDLELAFFLPAGTYATTVLHALGDCRPSPATRGAVEGNGEPRDESPD